MPASPDLPPPIVIAGHLALDFLNSRATPGTEPIDWLRDGRSMMDWAASLSLFPEAVLLQLRQAMAGQLLDEVATEARELRELLRVGLSQPRSLRASAEIRRKINDILARGCTFQELRAHGDGPRLEDVERLDRPGQLLVPLAKSIGRLIVEEDPARVRACAGAGCTLWFVDRTKTGSRRFCSPSVCGNRAKVAAFRARQRSG